MLTTERINIIFFHNHFREVFMETRLKLYLAGLSIFTAVLMCSVLYACKNAGVSLSYARDVLALIMMFYMLLAACRIEESSMSDSFHRLFILTVIFAAVFFILSFVLYIITGSEFDVLIGKVGGGILGFFAWAFSVAVVGLIFLLGSKIAEKISERMGKVFEKFA